MLEAAGVELSLESRLEGVAERLVGDINPHESHVYSHVVAKFSQVIDCLDEGVDGVADDFF